MSDDYVTITAKMKAKTPRAVLLDFGDHVSRESWVPRCCLHTASDIAVSKAAKDDELELRVREWIAEREGLL